MTAAFVILLEFGGFVLASFWLGVYCYGLYRLGRWIATRYRTRPVQTLTLILFASLLLAVPVMFIPTETLGHIWKATIALGIFITHAQGVGYGFWGGLELGKRSDNREFWNRTENWLKEWEDPPVPKWLKDEGQGG